MNVFSAIKKICDIYDWDGKGELDMFYLGDVVYALGFNITKKICVGLGQTDELNKKFAKYDEIVKLVQEAVKVPEGSGNYHDYIGKFFKLYKITKYLNMAQCAELCKLYDKNENGTMMLAELENVLSNLGKFLITYKCTYTIYLNVIFVQADEIPKEDTMALLAELCDPEDEDGFFPYTPFVDRLTGKS